MSFAREEARHDGEGLCGRLLWARWAVANSTPGYLPTSPDFVLVVAAVPQPLIMDLTDPARPVLKLVCCCPQALNADGGPMVGTRAASWCSVAAYSYVRVELKLRRLKAAVAQVTASSHCPRKTRLGASRTVALFDGGFRGVVGTGLQTAQASLRCVRCLVSKGPNAVLIPKPL